MIGFDSGSTTDQHEAQVAADRRDHGAGTQGTGPRQHHQELRVGGARRSARIATSRAEPRRGAWVPADIIGDSRATCRPTATRGTSARAVDPASYTWAVGHTWRHAFKEAADAFGKVSSRAGRRTRQWRTSPSCTASSRSYPSIGIRTRRPRRDRRGVTLLVALMNEMDSPTRQSTRYRTWTVADVALAGCPVQRQRAALGRDRCYWPSVRWSAAGLLLRWLPPATRSLVSARRRSRAPHDVGTRSGLTGPYRRSRFARLARTTFPLRLSLVAATVRPTLRP